MTANLPNDYKLLCHASSNTNEGHKPTYELVISFLWQCCPLHFTAASIAGATHEYTSEDLSHPVQKQIEILISTLKDFTRIRVVEQHRMNLTSGMSIKARSLGEG